MSVDGDTINGINNLFDSIGVVETIIIFVVVLFIWGLYKLIYSWGMNKFSEASLEKDRRITELTNLLADSAKTELSTMNNSHYLSIDDFKNLKNHPIFQNINYWLAVRINQMNLSNDTKNNIFKDYVTIRYNAVVKNWLNFINNQNIQKLNRNELNSSLVELIIKIAEDVNNNIEKADFPKDVLLEMEKSIQIVDKIIISAIESFTSNKHFENGFDVVYTLLTIKMHVLEVVFYDLVMILEKLNGSLEKIKYEPKFYKK